MPACLVDANGQLKLKFAAGTRSGQVILFASQVRFTRDSNKRVPGICFVIMCNNLRLVCLPSSGCFICRHSGIFEKC